MHLPNKTKVRSTV